MLVTRTFRMRTHDRITFKRCRRKWIWTSHLHGNLDQLVTAPYLWTGRGFHFALEDFHGLNVYGHPVYAFQAFAHACRLAKALPDAWEEEVELATGMLHYYVEWLQDRDPLQTLILNGEPQVEVNALIILPIEHPDWDEVVYSVTLDRVAIDREGNLWLVEYKTAKTFQTAHFQTDPQVSSYHWAAQLMYPNHHIAGVIYQQHRKDVPDQPRVLSSGRFSCNKSQATTRPLYYAALKNLYGSAQKAPPENIDFLNWLTSQEGEHYDHFIRRDLVYRNEDQLNAEYEQILMETEDMMDPNLRIYPNKTRECVRDCFLNSVCISKDDGSDWEGELADSTQQREEESNSWRQHLPSLEFLQSQQQRRQELQPQPQ